MWFFGRFVYDLMKLLFSVQEENGVAGLHVYRGTSICTIVILAIANLLE